MFTAERDASAATPAPLAWRILAALALTNFIIHLAFSLRYGFFRDELYYLACGQHLAWGYVDHPPLVGLLAKFSVAVFGSSLTAIRILPALASACTVFLTGCLAREFGGKRFAQILAAAAIFLAPAVLAFGSFFSMNAFEPLFWTLCALLLVALLKGRDPRFWLAFGAVVGVGALNKYTMAQFALALVLGLLLTPSRGVLRNKYVWLGGALALLIVSPNLIWQAHHHWAQFEIIRNARVFKNEPIGPLQFLLEQVLFLDPIAAPVWFAGLAWFFLAEEGKKYRALGWAFLAVLISDIALHGKSYYPLPAYPILMAAGGAALESFFAHRRRILAFAYVSLLIASGLFTLPFGVPTLPVENFIAYMNFVPLARPVRTERDATAELPQLYADMFGWPEMTATVARIYHNLPPAEQARCAILAGNYGEAGAIDRFGLAYGLPKAISPHNNYFLWGPREYSGEVVILFGDRAEIIKQYFVEVQQVAVISNPYAMPGERNLPVYLCRKPVMPLAQLWPRLRYFI